MQQISLQGFVRATSDDSRTNRVALAAPIQIHASILSGECAQNETLEASHENQSLVAEQQNGFPATQIMIKQANSDESASINFLNTVAFCQFLGMGFR
jgi:hypothetical protein